ncbi:MAG TPA: phosphoenolpyruvate kinase [Myxococcales bacterium]|nr:phosphoenolpyruvate kinase [Myxococcales bacterium]
MDTFLPDSTLQPLVARLRTAQEQLARHYPGEPASRQPVHTVYVGAHSFDAGLPRRLGAEALHSLAEFAPDAAAFAGVLGIAPALAGTVHARVVAKLRREAVEDLRIDFEDGYGNRGDAEEDGHAVQAAEELARAQAGGTLPPFSGIRIKSLSGDLGARSLRTLSLFAGTLARATGGRLPPGFVVTLPKVTSPEQVSVLIDAFEALEPRLALAAGTLKMEPMVEVTQTVLAPDGRAMLPALLAAARGRCVAAHFGTYDYTASCNVTALHQHMRHPACDFAKHMIQVAYAGTGIWLSDGATSLVPAGPHHGTQLTQAERQENLAAVHAAWRLQAGDIRHSLETGFYQGWDMHPAQIPVRYGAVYAFFLEGLPAASERLRNFVTRTSQATVEGEVFDDAATGQALLNFFLRGLNCGALTEEEALATGLTAGELRGRSFAAILAGRRRS